MKNQVIIDQQGLIDLLKDFAGHTFAYVRTLIPPSLNKTHRGTKATMFQTLGFEREQVRKISLYSILLGYDYRTGLENACKKEGIPIPVAGDVWWRHWVTPSGKDSSTIAIHPDHLDWGKYMILQLNQWVSKDGQPVIGPDGQPLKKKTVTRVRSKYVVFAKKANGELDMSTGKIVDKALLIPFMGPPKPHKLVMCQTPKISNVKMLAFQGQVYHLA